jgi:hypothetical protein
MLMLLRFTLTIALLGLVAYAGFNHQTYYVVALIFSTILTLAYIDGKIEVWQASIRTSGPVKVLANIGITFVIQFVLVSVFYFVAFFAGQEFYGKTGVFPVETLVMGGASDHEAASQPKFPDDWTEAQLLRHPIA